jgi:glutathione S-transferase
MMTIHNFPRGARGQRAMWVCEEMGLPYAVQAHAFPVGADYRALNPLGTVPFLEDADGVALNESVAIMWQGRSPYRNVMRCGNSALRLEP